MVPWFFGLLETYVNGLRGNDADTVFFSFTVSFTVNATVTLCVDVTFSPVNLLKNLVAKMVTR